MPGKEAPFTASGCVTNLSAKLLSSSLSRCRNITSHHTAPHKSLRYRQTTRFVSLNPATAVRCLLLRYVGFLLLPIPLVPPPSTRATVGKFGAPGDVSWAKWPGQGLGAMISRYDPSRMPVCGTPGFVRPIALPATSSSSEARHPTCPNFKRPELALGLRNATSILCHAELLKPFERRMLMWLQLDHCSIWLEAGTNACVRLHLS